MAGRREAARGIHDAACGGDRAEESIVPSVWLPERCLAAGPHRIAGVVTHATSLRERVEATRAEVCEHPVAVDHRLRDVPAPPTDIAVPADHAGPSVEREQVAEGLRDREHLVASNGRRELTLDGQAVAGAQL